MNENEKTCISCNDVLTQAANGEVVGGYLPPGCQNFEYEGQEAEDIRDSLKTLFGLNWTGMPPSLFDDGAMTLEVVMIARKFTENWAKCHMIINSLFLTWLIFNPIGALPGAVGHAFLVAVEGMSELIEPTGGLSGIKYQACRLAALNGIKTGLIMAMTYVG